MNGKTQILIRELIRLAHREHFHCDEDVWYDCPKSIHAIRQAGEKCNCGADEHNKEVDEIVKKLME